MEKVVVAETKHAVVFKMPDISVSVVDGTRNIVNGRVLRVDESSTLSSVLEVVVADAASRSRLCSVQTASTEDGKRLDATIEDDVALHIEFGRRFIFFIFGRRYHPSLLVHLVDPCRM